MFSKSTVIWRQLPKVDSSLTSQWVDHCHFSHKIAVDDEPNENDDMIVLQGFLDGEYDKIMLSVDYQPVSYLRSVSYQQVGLFAKLSSQK